MFRNYIINARQIGGLSIKKGIQKAESKLKVNLKNKNIRKNAEVKIKYAKKKKTECEKRRKGNKYKGINLKAVREHRKTKCCEN